MSERLKALAEAGVSIWLDDLSRERIETGNLADLVKNRSVTGVTTNPTIFAAAISGSSSYDDQLHALPVREVSVEEALRTITAADVRDACDLLAPVAHRTGTDGRVSLEVAPGLAHDTDATAAEAAHLCVVPLAVTERGGEDRRVRGDPDHRPVLDEVGEVAGLDPLP